jgi:putative FmdB family regulatory protein
MPIYAYKCASCGFAKDVLQKLSDTPLTECPSCGVSSFKKQVTAAGFQLKGSGWYATDFKGGAPAAAAVPAIADTPSTTADNAKPDAKADPVAPPSAGGCGGACACH